LEVIFGSIFIFIIGTLIYAAPPQIIGIFWYFSREFWSLICESPDTVKNLPRMVGKQQPSLNI